MLPNLRSGLVGHRTPEGSQSSGTTRLVFAVRVRPRVIRAEMMLDDETATTTARPRGVCWGYPHSWSANGDVTRTPVERQTHTTRPHRRWRHGHRRRRHHRRRTYQRGPCAPKIKCTSVKPDLEQNPRASLSGGHQPLLALKPYSNPFNTNYHIMYSDQKCNLNTWTK